MYTLGKYPREAKMQRKEMFLQRHFLCLWLLLACPCFQHPGQILGRWLSLTCFPPSSLPHPAPFSLPFCPFLWWRRGSLIKLYHENMGLRIK